MNSILEYQNDESSLEGTEGSIVSHNDEAVITSTVEIFGESILTIESDPITSILESTESITSILESVEEVTSILETSPPKGDKGDPGITSGMIVEYPVAYPMSGHRIVVLNENQEAIYASNLNPFHANKVLGMTIGAVISGNIGIQTGGSLEEPSWNWIIDVPIWLADNGLMTQTPPISGFSLIVGFPVSSTNIFIHIGIPFILI
jgi:hypothetical protein